METSSRPVNSVIRGNTAVEVGDQIEGAPDVEHSDVEGGWSGLGNIDADPLFVDATSGDFRLQEGSPCIDTGSNDSVPEGVTTDLDGSPRITDGDGDGDAGVDMGAYEYQL